MARQQAARQQAARQQAARQQAARRRTARDHVTQHNLAVGPPVRPTQPRRLGSRPLGHREHKHAPLHAEGSCLGALR
eukprot:3239834-Prymnesium_polylepis.1